jgi:2-polyprenyl-3-methyl-5-hydroxy-6-metoxy-1,4-benzoquinol methylase
VEASTVSVLIPAAADSGQAERVRNSVAQYLESTGLTFELLSLGAQAGEGHGAMLRRATADAHGGVIVVIDADLPYPVSAIGDAVAMIQSGATDLVFGSSRQPDAEHAPFLLRWLLVPTLPDPAVRLTAVSSAAARLVVGESKLTGEAIAMEMAFLANKYGFRVEYLTVQTTGASRASFTALSGLIPLLSVRLNDRRMEYRAPRRCPVCLSTEVWSWAQIPGNIVRACHRCKCRYLNSVAEEEEVHPLVRREIRPHAQPSDPGDDTHSQSAGAREKTSLRRYAFVRKQLTARARLLEIGVRDGSFGIAASRDYEYVGIDPVAPAARSARGRGLEVYCSTLAGFVNTGPTFDAVAMFHVFENLADPHDSLARLKDLVKPGGMLLLTTFDTEGLMYLLTERKRMAHNFRTHRILYSRSALIELLEHSGFEIDSVGPSFEYRDHKFLRHRIGLRWPRIAPLFHHLLGILPDPLLVSSGSIRIVAKRRSGPPLNLRAIRSAEPTHAR